MKKIFANSIYEYAGSEITELFILADFKVAARASCADLVLQDISGTLNGVLWNDHFKPEYADLKGCFVQVTGVVTFRDGSAQLTVSKIQPADLSKEDSNKFIETLSDEQFESAKKSILDTICLIQNPYLKSLIESIYTDEFFNSIRNLPGGITYHHVFNGGLLCHIAEVAYHCCYSMKVQNKFAALRPKNYEVNASLVYAGALLSDIGKCKIYKPLPIRKRTETSELSNFITEGLEILALASSNVHEAKDETLYNQLKHIIQHCHSSMPNCRPRTKEAIIIANADACSAGINAFDTSIMLHEKKGRQYTTSDIESPFFGYKLYYEGSVK